MQNEKCGYNVVGIKTPEGQHAQCRDHQQLSGESSSGVMDGGNYMFFDLGEEKSYKLH